MAVFIITAKAAFLPDPDDMAGWELRTHEGRDIFFRQVGTHRLYLTECIVDAGKKQRIKHDMLADVVRYAQRDAADATPESFYLIAHDKDLLKSGGNDEGIYREAGVAEVGSSLQGLLPDGHIYIFQHVAQQEMFEKLINILLDEIVPEQVDEVVQLIDGTSYETPFA